MPVLTVLSNIINQQIQTEYPQVTDKRVKGAIFHRIVITDTAPSLSGMSIMLVFNSIQKLQENGQWSWEPSATNFGDFWEWMKYINEWSKVDYSRNRYFFSTMLPQILQINPNVDLKEITRFWAIQSLWRQADGFSHRQKPNPVAEQWINTMREDATTELSRTNPNPTDHQINLHVRENILNLALTSPNVHELIATVSSPRRTIVLSGTWETRPNGRYFVIGPVTDPDDEEELNERVGGYISIL